jgi:hypothetical protein
MEKEHTNWNRPEDVTTQEFVGYVALDESPSDLAGQVVAALVASGLALLEYDLIERGQASQLVRSNLAPVNNSNSNLSRVLSDGHPTNVPH